MVWAGTEGDGGAATWVHDDHLANGRRQAALVDGDPWHGDRSETGAVNVKAAQVGEINDECSGKIGAAMTMTTKVWGVSWSD